jgi:hypothetical protein
MSAIDLIFGVKNDSERLHQIVLGPLLLRTKTVRHAFNDSIMQINDFSWEPEKRLFDLATTHSGATGKEAGTIWIEIKIDSALSEDQLRRQIKHIAGRPQDKILYLLLGYSGITTDRSLINKIRQEYKIDDSRIVVMNNDQLVSMFDDPDILPSIDDPLRSDARDLVHVYKDLLIKLKQRTDKFFEREVNSWTIGDYYGFFDYCRHNKVGEMVDAGINYVANGSGGFYGCWWCWQTVCDDAQVYLQFEGSKLCLRIWVGTIEKRISYRDKALEVLLSLIPHPILDLQKPARLGSGEYMTFGTVRNLPFGVRQKWSEFCRIVEASENTIKQLAKQLKRAF